MIESWRRHYNTVRPSPLAIDNCRIRCTRAPLGLTQNPQKPSRCDHRSALPEKPPNPMGPWLDRRRRVSTKVTIP